MQSTISQATPKRSKAAHLALCFLPLTLFALFFAGLYGRGWWLVMPIIFLQVLVPLLDLLTGLQDNAHFEKTEFSRAQIALLHWNPRLYAVLHMGSVIYVALHLNRFSGLEIGLLIGCFSLIGGICFAAAHEILHAKERIDQFLQRITTSFLFYPHYKLIHIRSHHVHTSTDHDENTAWLNETIYAYLARTIPGSAVRCWELEDRPVAGVKRPLWKAIFKNKMTLYAVGQVAILAAFYFFTGWQGLAFYVAQIIGSHIVLESVNYIQHYGLLRDQHDGQYEKPAAEHSWDTYHLFSSYVTFRVGHHSYHHLAVKPYYALATEPEAPKLPVGYFWAIPMVFLPPWWRRVINPKLKEGLVPA